MYPEAVVGGGRTLVDLAEGAAAEDGAQLGEATLCGVAAARAQLLGQAQQRVHVVALRTAGAAHASGAARRSLRVAGLPRALHSRRMAGHNMCRHSQESVQCKAAAPCNGYLWHCALNRARQSGCA